MSSTYIDFKHVEFIKSVPIDDCYVDSVTLNENITWIQGRDVGIRISFENNEESDDNSRWFVVPWSNVLYGEEDHDF